MIATRDLTFSYSGSELLSFPDVSCVAGDQLLILGDSGSGKTTLASKIAAYCKEHAIIDRIMLGAATGTGVNASDEIKDFARLMNMKSVNFSIGKLPLINICFIN